MVQRRLEVANSVSQDLAARVAAWAEENKLPLLID